jgi:murein DD-endopeptidase MepM/ murein hydrolase activator NlpD
MGLIQDSAKEGLDVHAAADGYVSRIKISTFGNGKAIYITHPNGLRLYIVICKDY